MRLAVDEWSRLRAIRLRALQDTPDAFGATFEEAAARSPDGWAQQLRDLPTFIAAAKAATSAWPATPLTETRSIPHG